MTISRLDAFDSLELLALARHDIEKERLDSAMEKLKRASADDAKCPLSVFAELGRLYAKLKLFDRAIVCFERFLAKVPDALNERFQLGMALSDAGNSAQAEQHWGRVLELAPLHPPALFFTALATAQRRDWETARARCAMILESVAVDNLYHPRAKELLGQIDGDPEYQLYVNTAPAGTGKKTSRKEH